MPQSYIPRTGTQAPWKVQRLGAGVWGSWSNPRVRAAVDCGETDQGNVREMPMEESLAAWKQGDTAESHVGCGTITIASLLPTQTALAAEQ